MSTSPVILRVGISVGFSLLLSCGACSSSDPLDQGASGRKSGTGGDSAISSFTGGEPNGDGGNQEGTGGSLEVKEPSGSGGSQQGKGSGGSTPALVGPDGFPVECSELPSLNPEATQVTKISLLLEVEKKALVFGEHNALSTGGTVLPTNFRFYLSQFNFYQGDERVSAQLLSPDSNVSPYGIQLVNAEDPQTLEFNLASPPGQYDEISFLLGLSEGCNTAFRPLNPPLDEASQLKWPHTLGFLFLRFEGQLSELVGPLTPNKIHMGRANGDGGRAPEFRLALPLEVGSGVIRLKVAFDAILSAAATEMDLSDFALPPPAPPFIDEEIYAGERLRRTATSVEIFADPAMD